MKRNKIFTLLALLMFISTGFAQKKKERLNVDFYCIDFSSVTVIGAKESEEKLMSAFHGINDLLFSEPKKYNVGKLLNLNIMSMDITHAKERIQTLENVLFKNRKSSIDLENILSHYPKSSNYGLLIVAKELNKATDKGHFTVVIFDGETKKIISTRDITGRTDGYGLRNYWANALLEALKRAR